MKRNLSLYLHTQKKIFIIIIPKIKVTEATMKVEKSCLNLIISWRQIEAILSVRWLWDHVSVTWRLHANNVHVRCFGLIFAAIENWIQFIGLIHSSATDGPWVSVIWIAATETLFFCLWMKTFAQWNTEELLVGCENYWRFWDDAHGRAHFDSCAIHGSWAANGNDNWCRNKRTWDGFRCLWDRLRLGTRTRWRLRSLRRGRRRIWTNDDGIIVGWSWRIARWKICVGWLPNDISFAGKNFWCWLSGLSDTVECNHFEIGISALTETTADFRSVTTTRLNIKK